MSTWAVTAASLRRSLRDRVSMFFIVLLPVAVILLIGVTVQGADKLRIGVVVPPAQQPLAAGFVADLRSSKALKVNTYADASQARLAVRRVEVVAAVIVPADFDALLAKGTTVTVPVLRQTGETTGSAAMSAIESALARTSSRVQAATFAQPVAGSFAAGLLAADRAAASVTPVRVSVVNVTTGSNILPAGFSYSAPTMLVLFVFINALARGAAVVQTEQLGIYGRAMAAPVGAARIVLGETLAYLLLALLQAVIIIAAGGLLFGVSWGSPVGATAVVLLWCLVGTGAGMLSGTVFRTVEQATSIGPAVGIAAGMLGGCMWPLAIVPGFMRVLGHVTPHAWAVDAWTRLLSRHVGITGIGWQLAVLAAFAVVLLTSAVVRLRARVLA